MQLNRVMLHLLVKDLVIGKTRRLCLKTTWPLLLIRKHFRFFIANNLLRYWRFVKRATLRHEEGQQRMFSEDSIKCTVYLAKQGIAFCGDGAEIDSNFMQILKLHGKDNHSIETWLQSKTDKYVSHDIRTK